MSDRLIDLQGVGPVHAETLATHGLTTTSDLLDRAARPSGRASLAADTGIPGSLILEWVNHADLFRISGIAGQYSDLLEEAGVDTVVELARRNPENLTARMAEVNAAKNLVNRVPSLAEVERWIAEATSLPRAVFYDDGDDGNGTAATVGEPAQTPAPAMRSASASPAPQPTPSPSPPTFAAATPATPPAAATASRTGEERGWWSRLVGIFRGR